MKRGRQAAVHPCPLCRSSLTRLGHSAYFRCSCAASFILEKGQLRQMRGKRGRIKGDRVAPVEPKFTGKFLSASEFERLQGPAPYRKMRNR